MQNCHFCGFPCGSAGKESTCNVGDLGWIPGLGRSPGEGKGYPLQYSGLENSTDCIVHGIGKSWTRLSDFHFHFHPGINMLAVSTYIRRKVMTSLDITLPTKVYIIKTIFFPIVMYGNTKDLEQSKQS